MFFSEYVDALISDVLGVCRDGYDDIDDGLDPLDIPPNLNATFHIPHKPTAVAERVSRFQPPPTP